MSNVSVVFNADTGQFVTSVDGATKSVQKSAEAVTSAKNQILASYKMQVAAAKEVGASASELEAIQRRSAQMMASVTETNANRVVSALDRMSAKQKEVAASMATLNAVAPAMREVGDAADYQASRFQRSQAAMQALRGNFTRNSRAAEAFLSTMGPMEGVISAAFPIIGAVTFGMVIWQGIEALQKMYEKAQQVPSAIAEGFASINEPLRANANALQQDNDALQATIDKLEHKPNDGLALALDDARKRTDELTKSAHTASDAIAKLLNEQKVGAFGELLGKGGTGQIDAELKKRFGGITAAQNEDEKQFDYADTMARTISDPKARKAAEKAAQDAQAARQAAIGKQLVSMQDYIRSTRGKINGTTQAEDYVDPKSGQILRGGTVSYAKRYGDQTANNNMLNGAEDVADSMQLQRVRMATNVQLTGQAKGLQGGKDLATAQAEAARKAFDALKQEWQSEDDARKLAGSDSATIETNTWTQRAAALKVGSQSYLYARQQAAESLKQATSQWTDQQRKDAVTAQKSQRTGWDTSYDSWSGQRPRTAQQTGDFWGMRALEATPGSDNEKAALDKMTAAYRDAARAAQESDKARTKAAEDATKNAAAYEQAAVAIQLQTGQISKLDAAQQLANIHAQQYAQTMATLQKTLAQQQAIDPNSAASINAQAAIAKAAADRSVQVMQDAANTAATSWQGALTNANAMWVQDAQDSAKQVVQLYTTALNGFNGDIANLATGGKSNFSGTFRSIGRTVATTGLKRIEAPALSALGLAGKPDGTASNPLYVKFASYTDQAPSIIKGLSGGSGALTSLTHSLWPHGAPSLPNVSSSGFGFGSQTPSDMSSLLWPSGAPSMPNVTGGGTSSSIIPASTTDQTIGGIVRIAGNLVGLFGGGKALGGPVQPGVSYDVGEMGRERFTPTVPGVVTPHNQLSGGDVYYNVSVANGVTPQETDMRVRAALEAYHPQGVKAAVQAVHDHQSRNPSSRG